MSQFTPPPPPPPDSLGYATPMHQPNRRPTVVTVLAILAIIFGSLGVLGGICNIPQYLGVRLMPNPILDGIQKDGVMLTFMLTSLAINLILSVILLIAGIGSLSLKPSSRVWMIRYALIHIVVTAVSLLLGLTFITARNHALMQKTLAANPQLNTPQMKMVLQYSTTGGYCFAIVFLIWPLLILYYMNRPQVKAAFDPALPPLPPTQPYA
jgi:uncharacterized protein YneF (UPF0154 family)